LLLSLVVVCVVVVGGGGRWRCSLVSPQQLFPESKIGAALKKLHDVKGRK
jgi:hypothetical protein